MGPVKQRIKTVLCAYGVIVRPWLCVVAYLWILALQSVYGTDSSQSWTAWLMLRRFSGR
jgi:hypothetical protein